MRHLLNSIILLPPFYNYIYNPAGGVPPGETEMITESGDVMLTEDGNIMITE